MPHVLARAGGFTNLIQNTKKSFFADPWLIKIVPRLDLQRDILPLIQFDVDIAADLKTSVPVIYRPGRMKLWDREEWRD